MGKISSFFTGAAIGIAAALLFAPRTGEETRALVTEKANAVVGEAKDFADGIPGSAQDAFKAVQNKGQEIASNVQAPAAAQPDDELREKIEAARKRIAAQVAENAEESKSVEVAAE